MDGIKAAKILNLGVLLDRIESELPQRWEYKIDKINPFVEGDYPYFVDIMNEWGSTLAWGEGETLHDALEMALIKLEEFKREWG